MSSQLKPKSALLFIPPPPPPPSANQWPNLQIPYGRKACSRVKALTPVRDLWNRLQAGFYITQSEKEGPGRGKGGKGPHLCLLTEENDLEQFQKRRHWGVGILTVNDFTRSSLLEVLTCKHACEFQVYIVQFSLTVSRRHLYLHPFLSQLLIFTDVIPLRYQVTSFNSVSVLQKKNKYRVQSRNLCVLKLTCKCIQRLQIYVIKIYVYSSVVCGFMWKGSAS